MDGSGLTNFFLTFEIVGLKTAGWMGVDQVTNLVMQKKLYLAKYWQSRLSRRVPQVTI